MEKIQVAEIVTAAWRLRRCGLLEEALDSAVDPERVQKSIDRARIQAHGLQLRATAELRRLRRDTNSFQRLKPSTTKQSQSSDLTEPPKNSPRRTLPSGVPAQQNTNAARTRRSRTDKNGALLRVRQTWRFRTD